MRLVSKAFEDLLQSAQTDSVDQKKARRHRVIRAGKPFLLSHAKAPLREEKRNAIV